MLKIALPNGTLEKRTVEIFAKTGVQLERRQRCYHAKVKDDRIERVTFMRPQMIPWMVEEGQYDIGVVGSDVVAETGRDVTVLSKLDYSGRGDREFRVVLFGAQDDPVQCMRDIRSYPTILSEFPKTTRRALDTARVLANILFSHGTTEANVPHDFPYGVCVTSTGETLRANGLKIIEVLSIETTVAIGGPSRFKDTKKEHASISLLGDLTR